MKVQDWCGSAPHQHMQNGNGSIVWVTLVTRHPNKLVCCGMTGQGLHCRHIEHEEIVGLACGDASILSVEHRL